MVAFIPELTFFAHLLLFPLLAVKRLLHDHPNGLAYPSVLNLTEHKHVVVGLVIKKDLNPVRVTGVNIRCHSCSPPFCRSVLIAIYAYTDSVVKKIWKKRNQLDDNDFLLMAYGMK